MSPTLEPIHRLAQGVRKHGPALLAGMPDPHDELMSLVAADHFDTLHSGAQGRLRKLIVRHRALRVVDTARGPAHGADA